MVIVYGHKMSYHTVLSKNELRSSPKHSGKLLQLSYLSQRQSKIYRLAPALLFIALGSNISCRAIQAIFHGQKHGSQISAKQTSQPGLDNHRCKYMETVHLLSEHL